MKQAALRAAAAAALVLAAAPAGAGETVTVTAEPIAIFAPTDPGRVKFGRLTYLRGAVLHPDTRRFGGISSIDIAADGQSLVAVTDVGDWITATLAVDDTGTPTLNDIEMEHIRGEDGKPLTTKPWSDAEGVAAVAGSPGRYRVSFERRNRIWEFDLGRDGLTARPADITVPQALRELPENKGPEAIATFSENSPLGAATLAFAETQKDGFFTGFILGGKAPGTFRLRAPAGFDVTDAALDPDGNLIVLERYFSILTGPKMALHRIRAAEIAGGATIYPELLMEADVALEIDNMEALAIHRDQAGRTIVTMMSDNNFTRLQRTLLLQFELTD